MESEQTSFASVYNFVTNFKPEEIDDVIRDIELRNRGFRILYAIDTFDIVAHYLPYTEGGLFLHKNKNELAQKLICYDYFFSLKESLHGTAGINETNQQRNKCIIILNEYKIELLSVKNKIMKQLKDVSHVISNLDYLKKETYEFQINHKGANAYFEKNFELILLLLILSEKKDFVHKDFEDFLKNRLSIMEISSGSEQDDSILNKIFSDTRHSDLSVQLFDRFISENKYDLISIDKEIDRYIYLENTFRDVQAIDRLLGINDKLAKADEKYVILYLSSAPYKTKELFKGVGHLNNIGEINFPHIKNLFINRNIYQCFLYEILCNEFSNTDLDISKALNSLRKLAAKLENKEHNGILKMEWEDEDMNTLKKLKNIFDLYSASLDNHFYIKIYEKYKDLYNSVSTNTKNEHKIKKNIDLMPIFSLIDEFIHGDDFKQKYFDFTFTVNQLKHAVEIANIISKSNPIIPNILFNKDIIKNSFHHLPYLLFLFENEKNSLLVKLYDLLNNLVDVSYPDHELLPELSINLKKVVSSLVDEQSDIYLISLQQIIISYINLITTTPKTNAQDESDKEEEIIDTLVKQRQIFGHLKVEAILNENASTLDVKFKPHAFSREIDYILLWLYRRNNQIHKGIKLGKHLIYENPDDPRFYHGLALNYISNAYKSLQSVSASGLSDTQAIGDLKNALLYLRFAKEKYEALMGADHQQNFGMLINKNYMAVLNSLADISLRIYEHEVVKDFSRIEEARGFLDRAKELFTITNLIYNNFPIFSATELEIEYYEALNYYEKESYSLAHQKIINAVNRKVILDQNISKTPIDSRFLTINKKINELSGQIFKHISKR